ncbi:hypothetical protein TNIN_222751 [Trichonephila inaurata madagascariensis]|uniref:Uncharacterized protein n=1 Tax=Trichonephila inaurata madagascariensis TaxID=2747483 RepID=A0A8X7BZC1_9ARAC|nr:hypothetical protein TNIN_222751 [Trichonephila inaurata madagascariensis]
MVTGPTVRVYWNFLRVLHFSRIKSEISGAKKENNGKWKNRDKKKNNDKCSETLSEDPTTTDTHTPTKTHLTSNTKKRRHSSSMEWRGRTENRPWVDARRCISTRRKLSGPESPSGSPSLRNWSPQCALSEEAGLTKSGWPPVPSNTHPMLNGVLKPILESAAVLFPGIIDGIRTSVEMYYVPQNLDFSKSKPFEISQVVFKLLRQCFYK